MRRLLKKRHRARSRGNGQFAIVRGGLCRVEPDGAPRARFQTEATGEFASACTATRAQNATVRIADAAQRFVSAHFAVYNTFNVRRHLISRRTLRLFRAEAVQEWRTVTTAT